MTRDLRIQLIDRGLWKNSMYLPQKVSGDIDWNDKRSLDCIEEELESARIEATQLLALCANIEHLYLGVIKEDLK